MSAEGRSTASPAIEKEEEGFKKGQGRRRGTKQTG
jgi:hypothetical protein